ncbi:hypothetical protein BW730_14675 [Tessaracoccus aquimaris]|uniref:VWFA domain-containing protein n=1 Tax=Tessaracoccus aquimaris TaxID=1332264 RepID=A0A1Q2CR16_9ACTN|nr:SpaA isopeptide-forming pilin-related protein [Tessaracoccus aquimaris]AQP48559.1 hypothetical protein BW730_14675 [Tessaracoccus aquimaris]
MSASLVFASGLAYAQETTPTPTPGAVDTPVAPSDSTETPIVVVDPIVTDDETTPVEPQDTPTKEPAPETQPAATPAAPEPKTGAQPRIAGPAIVPMAVPANVQPPYVYWTVEDGNAQPVGGATFTLQGPRGSGNDNGAWSNAGSVTVTDCVTAGCPGPDLDPAPGAFAVKYIGTHSISNSSRYRLQRATTPPGYSANGRTGWEVVPGQLFNSNSASPGWLVWNSDRTYDFGNFPVAAPPRWNVTVKKGTYRNGTAASAVSAEHTAGVRFGMSETESSAPFATCEIPSTNLGNCLFTGVAPPDGDLTVFIRELTAAPGSDAATHLGEPITNLSTGAYRIQTVLPTGGGSVTVPADSDSPDRTVIANRAINPMLPQTCSAGATVAVVLDTSGSVDAYRDSLAQATTALVDGLVGTPSSVALFSFAASSPGGIANQATPLSVETATDAAAVKQLYATNNGQTAAFSAGGGTNWDRGLWVTSQGYLENGQRKGYDIVFVLTDGNPTLYMSGNSNPGNTGDTTTGELEKSIFSANAVKKTGARIITVGIGGGLNDGNLGAISGPNKYSPGDTLNDFDFITADWAELEAVLNSFAQGLKCEASVTVEKQAKPYGGSYAPAAGWEFGLTSTGADSQEPTTNQDTNAAGQATWTLKFTDTDDTATAVLTEIEDRAGWSLADLTCDVDGTTVDLAGKKVTIPGIGIGQNVTCTFMNEERQVGSLAITKAFADADAQAFGASVNFQGGYTCSLDDETVASGTWVRQGSGAAVLTAAAGSPAPDAIPANASCTVTETTPTGGLPNASWTWATPTVTDPVTITNATTSTVTVTNAVERVYGNFQVTKQLAAGSTADAGLTYSGGWTCTLGTEIVNGTWGPIAAGATWASSDAAGVPVGASCAVTSETRDQWPVADDHSHQWDGEAGFSAAVVSAKQSLGTVTVTNTTKRVLGSVTWSKVDATDSSLLAGSEWTITGPGFPAPGQLIADCVGDDAATCAAGPDTNPAEGEFVLMDLLWGDYTVTETTAPTGYVGGVSFTFTVAEATVDVEAGIQANERETGTIEWTKVDATDQSLLAGSVWTLSGPGDATRDVVDCVGTCTDDPFTDQDPDAGQFSIEGLAWGDYTLTEKTAPDGYTASATSIPFTIDATNVSETRGLGPVTNERIPGSVGWTKVDGSGTLLAGSEWSLTGPDGEVVAIADCIATDAEECLEADKHPGEGVFVIEDLAWGAYTLVETKAPPGYLLDATEHPFTIGVGDDATLTADLGAVENLAHDGPELPLTGGIGRDQIILAGAFVALLAAVGYAARRRFARVV